MNNIEYIQSKLQLHYSDKTVSLTNPKDKISGTYFLDVEHIVITWNPTYPYRFGMSAEFCDPAYTNSMDQIFDNLLLDNFVEKIIGFIDNKLITTVEIRLAPEEYRARFGN